MPEHLVPMMATARPGCPRGSATGRSRSSGTAYARSPTSQPGRLRLESRNLNDDHRRATRSCAGCSRTSACARRCSTGRSSRSTRRHEAELRAPAAADAPQLRERRAPARGEPPGRVRDLRPAVPRRALADRAAVHRAPRGARGARARRAARGECPPRHRGRGPRLLDATREQGLEGVVAKRLDSHYEPGRRSGAWLKIKNTLRQELVIGGWVPGEGRRSDRIGALLMGYRRGSGVRVRRTRRDRLHRADARRARRASSGRCAARVPRSRRGADSRAGRCSSSRAWWRRSSSASGRVTA